MRSQSRQVNFSRTVWITFHWRGTTSSVSVTSSPILARRAEPQAAQAQGGGSTTRSRGRCSGKGLRTGLRRAKAATSTLAFAAAASASASSSEAVASSLDHAGAASRRIVDQPWRIMTIGLRKWAHGSSTVRVGIDRARRSCDGGGRRTAGFRAARGLPLRPKVTRKKRTSAGRPPPPTRWRRSTALSSR
jgi:hypothetical protein